MVVIVHHLPMYSLTPYWLLLGNLCLFRAGKLKITGSSTCRWYVNPEIPEAEALRNRFDQFDNIRFDHPQNLPTCFKLCKCRSVMATPLWQDGHSMGSNARPVSITELSKYEDPHEILVTTWTCAPSPDFVDVLRIQNL
jgi:hypothetical protein